MIRALICHAIFFLAAAPVAFSQKSYFDKKASINIKPEKSEFVTMKTDTLNGYFDRIFTDKAEAKEDVEVYQVTFETFAPESIRVKYCEVRGKTLATYEVFEEQQSVVVARKIYGRAFVDCFRLLMDSTFWDYKKPQIKISTPAGDGGKTKIEGRKGNMLKMLEQSSPTNRDTLFTLPERFFRRY